MVELAFPQKSRWDGIKVVEGEFSNTKNRQQEHQAMIKYLKFFRCECLEYLKCVELKVNFYLKVS